MHQNGVNMENVWNVDAGAAVTPTLLASIGAIFDGWVTTNFSQVSHTSLKYDEIVVTDISVANGAQDIRVPTTTQGAGVGVESAGNAAFVASLRTLHTGKNFRGRTYVAGVPQSQLTDAQHVFPTYAANVNGQLMGLITLLVSGGFKLVVLSRYLNKALRVVAVLTEVISVITDTKIDSQQRRTAN
jgi:hypothetical protein